MPMLQKMQAMERTAMGTKIHKLSLAFSLCTTLRPWMRFLSLQDGPRLPEQARYMTKAIGIRLWTLHPRKAVGMFFDGYTTKATRDWHYKHTSTARVIVATLITLCFCDRAFQGSAKHTQDPAKISACQVFSNDPEILLVAENLPPTVVRIRRLRGLEQRP